MSEAQTERRLPDAEIKKKVQAFWDEELEWVRQHPNPDLSEFEASIEREMKRSGMHRLPPLEMAMWPGSVLCDMDVSDSKKFNDRFIELPTGTSSHWFFRGLHGTLVSFLLFAFLMSFHPDVDVVDAVILGGGVLFLLGPLLFWMHWISWSAGVGGARYNRQAQLVHEMDHEGNVAHVPWRNIRPVVNIGVAPSSILVLYAPRPRPILEEYKLNIVGNPKPWPIEKTRGIFQVAASLHYLDHSAISSNLQRLEFLRRYMEHGISAIQPSEEAVRLGLVKKPQAVGKTQDMKELGGLMKYLFYPVGKVWYWICLGPLLDRRARAAAARTRWPQEVEDLCGPNPDLRGLNTRPVRSSTQHYYKPTAYSWTVVDRNGNPTFSAKAMPPGAPTGSG